MKNSTADELIRRAEGFERAASILRQSAAILLGEAAEVAAEEKKTSPAQPCIDCGGATRSDNSGCPKCLKPLCKYCRHPSGSSRAGHCKACAATIPDGRQNNGGAQPGSGPTEEGRKRLSERMKEIYRKADAEGTRPRCGTCQKNVHRDGKPCPDCRARFCSQHKRGDGRCEPCGAAESERTLQQIAASLPPPKEKKPVGRPRQTNTQRMGLTCEVCDQAGKTALNVCASCSRLGCPGCLSDGECRSCRERP